MTTIDDLATSIARLTHLTPADARDALASQTSRTPGDLPVLINLVRQAPATHSTRTEELDAITEGGWDDPTLAAAAHLLRTTAPRYPQAPTAVTVPPMSPGLEGALHTLDELDRAVVAPWTLIGGLMVMLHCLEHDVGPHRVTEDADVAINVFTHRGGLREVTAELARRGFADTSPEPMASRKLLSYRWTRGSTKVDLMVPEFANAQESVPHAVNRRPSVEMPAVQQALARTERLPVRLDDGTTVNVHRPNLLGALVVKAAAAIQDSREPRAASRRSGGAVHGTCLLGPPHHLRFAGEQEGRAPHPASSRNCSSSGVAPLGRPRGSTRCRRVAQRHPLTYRYSLRHASGTHHDNRYGAGP